MNWHQVNRLRMDYDNKVLELEENIQNMDQNNANLLIKINGLEEVIRDLTTVFEQRCNKYERDKILENNRIKEINQNNIDLRININGLEKVIGEYKNATSVFEQRCNKYESDKILANNRIQEINQNNVNLRININGLEKDIREYKNASLVFEQRCNKYESDKISENNRIKEINQSKRNYKQKISELEKKYENLEKTNRDHMKTIQEMETRKFTEFVKDKSDHQQEIAKVNQDKTQEMQQRIVEELSRVERGHHQEIDNMNLVFQRSLEDREYENQNLMSINQSLRNELDTIRSSLDTIKNRDMEPIRENINNYDCILNVENFRDISDKGWVLELPSQENDFKQKKSGSIFALVGLYNKGKTFILNQLTDSLFGSGQSYTTKGISMKEVSIDGDKFFVLDTAGTNSPIDLTKIEEKDKKITEVFIQDLALSIADYFILVVNDFTSKDQKILRRIVDYVKEQRQFKSIFVIHNFKDVKEKALHMHVWQEQVIKIFSPIEKNGEMNTLVNVALDSGIAVKRMVPYYRAEHTTHYSLVSNSSQYGVDFNRSSIQLIKDTIKRQITHANTSTLYKILLDKIRSSLINADLSIDEKQNSEIIRSSTIENWATLVPRRGLKFLQQNEFEPIFDQYILDDKYHIILDVPGMSLDDIDISCMGYLTTISGTRKRDHNTNTSDTHRRFGKFSLDFHIPVGFNPVLECNPQVIGGILNLEYATQGVKVFKGKNTGSNSQ